MLYGVFEMYCANAVFMFIAHFNLGIFGEINFLNFHQKLSKSNLTKDIGSLLIPR